ncbi:MAG: PVC-type heme-binding CxxCH protein, partial [Pirellulaceae bacterium]
MLGQLITALRTGRVGKGVIGARALGIGAVCLGLLADCRNLSAVEIPLNGHTFTLPDGFDIELIAGPPLVNRPITADFDEQGRLYVSDSSGSNEKVQVQLEQKPHRILRLEDVDGDGVFDRSQVFADRLMFPEGTMWYDGSLYVAAPPSIWKFTDVDGDGVAEHREEWFQGKTLTGCANDLHGPYFGPDGWIYWCKGAFAEQTYTIGGREWKTRASHIFRCRPDGTGIEPVMTGGMDNPVDTVFLPNGDRVFTTTFLVHPGNGQRDGLIHAVYGGVYGKEQGALDGHPRTGELMPVLSHLGAAAPCGLTRYESTAFGDDFRDNLFAAQFNMHKISRHKLTRRGASYVAEDSDFVVSNNIDFHTTDVLADADGSLIVVDTGGWYKLCCPTSQLHKPDILGALYRIRRTGAPRVEDPRGRGIAWSQLSAEALREKFGDPRPAVRRRAMHEFASRFGSGESLPALAGPWGIQASARASAESEKNLVWALTRVDHPVARELVRQRVSESATDDEVRQVALQSISLWRDTGARDVLVRQLLVGSPYARRVAAEALGRLGDRTVVPQLLAAAQALDSLTLPPRTPAGATAGGTTSSSEPGSAPATTALSGSETDRALEHAITYALIQLGDPSATALGLASDHPWTRRVALVALDQMPGGGLAADQVTPLLSATDPVVRETAHWIVSHHADWGSQLAGYFARRLAAVGKKTTGSVEGAASADPELEQ